MHEEFPYLEEYLTDIEVADARSPRYCKGYPECNDCACTRKVRFEGEPLLDHVRRTDIEPCEAPSGEDHPTRWLGWRGRVSPDEARRNRACESTTSSPVSTDGIQGNGPDAEGQRQPGDGVARR